MKKTEIAESLHKQLRDKGADLSHFCDLIDDYVLLWETKNALAKDIKKRGVTYVDLSSVGVEMQKNNPAVKEIVMVNRQMMSILKELGITTAGIVKHEDTEEM